MPAKSARKRSAISSALSADDANDKRVYDDKMKSGGKPMIFKLIKFLAIVYFIIWILIGLFFLAFIYGNWKQGAFKGLFGKPPAQQTQVQAPTETDLPGVGKVNISCVQSSLTSDAIQKIVSEGNTSALTDEEKAKLEPCITQKEEASTSPNK